MLFCLCVLVGCGEKNEEARATAPEAKVIPIFDSNDKNHVKIAREIGGTRELTESDLEKVTELGLHALELTDASVLSRLTQLEKLSLWSNKLTDINALAGLKKLKYLEVMYNQLTNVSAVAKLTQLEDLILEGNNLTDEQLKHLAGLAQLKELSLAANSFTDVSAFSQSYPIEGAWPR